MSLEEDSELHMKTQYVLCTQTWSRGQACAWGKNGFQGTPVSTVGVAPAHTQSLGGTDPAP